MANNEATVTLNADISKLQSEMQKASRVIKLANAEFKAAAAGMDKWSNNSEGLEAKLKQLNKVLGAQKTQLSLLDRELEDTIKLNGENSAAADRVRIKIENQKAAIANTEKQINQYDKELKIVNGDLDDTGDNLDDVSESATTAADGFTVMKGALANLVADGIRLAISALKDFAKETLTVGASFEQGMSKVGAVSGATAEELDQLTEKAKEMGAKTKFSASESAEAFNYMAMAGWKTEDMLNGIEGIMNLAAASGSDLATTSDIVTDALTAMGYGAEDAGRLADVMAAASSNANTNVEMMGQTFQYAAPLIGALGMNMEDAAVAIGLMANAGIKGTKSGTALRSMLTRLSAPPKECAVAMDALGISLTDSDGKMKSLDAVIQDLRRSFSKLSETEQTHYAKSIAGQEAMAGLLAIVNAAPADYAKLTKAVKESEGAAQSMADTMNDNVSGQMTLLRSQIEGVQIQLYEKFAPALKEGVKQISEVIDGVNWDKVGDKLGKFVSKAVGLFKRIVENADGIIETMKSVGTVIAATFVVNKLLTFTATIINVVKTLKTLKTATEAATTAQKLLNIAQAATPVGIAAAAVAGLTTGLVYLATKSIKAKEATNTLTDAQKDQIETVNAMAAAYDEMKASRDENVQSINAEFNYYKELAAELDTLVDKNGKVKDGYKERAEFIVGTLNEALGTEIKMVGDVVTQYEKVSSTLDEVLQKKKAEAILNANQESYTEAIKNQKQALSEYIETRRMYNEKVAEQQELERKGQELASMTVEEYAKLNGFGRNYVDAADAMGKAQGEVNRALAESSRSVYEARKAYKEAEGTYIGYENTIKNYEGLSASIISGDTAKIKDALQNMENDFISAESGTKSTLEQQVRNMEANYQALQQAVREGAPGVTQEMVTQAGEMVKKSKDELDKFVTEAEDSAKNAKDAYIRKFGSGKYEAEKAGREVRESAEKGLTGTEGSQTAGANLGQGYIDGMKSKDADVKSTAKGLGSDAVDGLNEGQDSHSPSRLTMVSGQNFAQGFINGMDSKGSTVYQKAVWLAKKAIQGLKEGQKEGSPSKITMQSGIYFTEGYINGIKSKSAALIRAVKGIVAESVDTLNTKSAIERVRNTGVDLMQKYATPISIGSTSASVGRLMAASQPEPKTSAGTTSTINNNYNLVQNNTSPKSLSALDTYMARRQQIAMLQAMT